LKIDEKRSLLSKSKQRTQLDGVQAALLAAGIQEGARHGQETPGKSYGQGPRKELQSIMQAWTFHRRFF